MRDETTLVLSQEDVASLLQMPQAIRLMEETLRDLAVHDAVMPVRTTMKLPGGVGTLGLMPAYLRHPERLAVKVIGIFPGNRTRGVDSHPGAVLLFEADTGRLLALIEASAVTAIRTAAVSGAATRALARRDAKTLALLGSGVQAATHLDAMRVVRDVQSVRVWSRTEAHAARFAEAMADRHGIPVIPVESAHEAVQGADIICTVTASRVPVLHGASVRPGTHINVVGASTKDAREVDAALTAHAQIYVDRRDAAWSEAGELILAERDGLLDPSQVRGELGEVLAGRVLGREHAEQITLFKSLGVAAEDVATAHWLYTAAQQAHRGTRVPFGGAPFDIRWMASPH